MGVLVEWWQAFWVVLVESGVWLLAGFLIAGVLHVLVPRSLLERALGGRGVGPVVRGALVGAPLPLCSCSVIPTAAGLKRSGASRGASAAFAVASPEVDVPAVGLTWGLLGPWFAITRPIVAVAIAVAAGLSLDREPKSRKRAGISAVESGLETASASEPGGRTISLGVLNAGAAEVAAQTPTLPGTSCCATTPKEAAPHGLWPRVFEVLRFAYVTLPGALAGWMLIGLALAAVVTVLVPADWVSSGGGGEGGWVTGLVGQSLIALVIGVPLYVCATSSTPMALAMIAAGVEPGAALVFLLAGPATNPATVAWVVRDFGGRSAAVYVAVIGGGALLAGLGLNGILREHMVLADLTHVHEHGGAGIPDLAAAVLLAVLVIAAGRNLAGRFARSAARGSSCCSE